MSGFTTTDAEGYELDTPTPEELARLRAKWQARVKGPLAGLLDAGYAEFINDEANDAPTATPAG